MAYTQPVHPADLAVHVTSGCADAAVYQRGALADHGHYDEVLERLVEALGVDIEHDSNPFTVDERGRTAVFGTVEAMLADAESPA